MKTIKIPISFLLVFLGLFLSCDRTTVIIDTNPQGAELAINGKSMGQTPWKGKLGTKPFAVELSLDGYETISGQDISLKDLQNTIGEEGSFSVSANKQINFLYNLYPGDFNKDLKRAIEIRDSQKIIRLFDDPSMTDRLRAEIFGQLIDLDFKDGLEKIMKWASDDQNRIAAKHRLFRMAYTKKYDYGIATLFPIPQNINDLQPDGSTALIDAVKNDNPELIGYLLDAGAKITIADSKGISPIQWALDLNLFRPLYAFRDKDIDVFSYNGKNSGDYVKLANYRLKYAAKQLSENPDDAHFAKLSAAYNITTAAVPFDSLYRDVKRMFYFGKAMFFINAKKDNSVISYMHEAIKEAKDNTNHLYFYGHLTNIDLFSWTVEEEDDAPCDRIVLELMKAHMRLDLKGVATFWGALYIRLRPDRYEWLQTAPELQVLNADERFRSMIEDENPEFR